MAGFSSALVEPARAPQKWNPESSTGLPWGQTCGDGCCKRVKRQIEGEEAKGELLAPSKTPLPSFLEDFCKSLSTVRTRKTTLNKDIRNLNAFLHWAVKNRFIAPDLEVKKIKVAQKPVTALSPQQVRDLVTAASRHSTLRSRVLLAVTTGLRRGDIETIRVGDIHFDRNTFTTRNRKAGKAMAERPIAEPIMTELSNHVATLPDGQERLFSDRFSPKKWEKVRKGIGLPDLKFHDLCKTFASLLAQRGVSTAVTQRLLEHSSPQLTNEVYTNIDPVLRQAVDLLPVADWV